MNKNLRSEFRHIAFLVCLSGTPLIANAQSVPGVTEKTVILGSCSALEGPSLSLGVDTVTGANAYFSLVNEEGGVNGRKLKLISYDDSYDPAKTQVCFDRLLGDNVFAMGLFVGTPTAVKYVPLAKATRYRWSGCSRELRPCTPRCVIGL